VYRGIVKVTILQVTIFSYLYFCVIPLLIFSSFNFFIYTKNINQELVIEGSRGDGEGAGLLYS